MTARELVRSRLDLDQPDRPERDADLPCPSRAFEPGLPAGTCETDGHYMCRECEHADPRAIAARDE